MSDGRYKAVLNPFSDEGKEIVQESPPFDSLPDEIADRAVQRVNWSSGPEVKVDFDSEDIRREVLSFYLMCQGTASVSYPYSDEVRKITESTSDVIRYRLFDLFRRGKEDLCLDTIRESFRLVELERGDGTKLRSMEIPEQDIYKLRDQELGEEGIDIVDDEVLPQYVPKYAIRWPDLIPLIEHRRIDLTDQYVVDGWAVLSPKKLWDFFAGYVRSELEDYVSELYDKFSESGPPSEVLEEVGERISDEIPESARTREYDRESRGELKPSAFPPCVEKVLGGVGSGNRNYGVVVLLSSFLSYARISPSGKSVNRVADYIEDISVIEEDVIPLIFEAAEKCRPPLFEDQPQDKANVYYHMGFGMTTKPRLRDSGKSKWYRPPNCRKIKTESPALCNPDDLCSEIKNPLTYYYKKFSQSSGSEEG